MFLHLSIGTRHRPSLIANAIITENYQKTTEIFRKLTQTQTIILTLTSFIRFKVKGLELRLDSGLGLVFGSLVFGKFSVLFGNYHNPLTVIHS